MHALLSTTLVLVPAGAFVSSADLQRARLKVPRDNFRGSGAAGLAAKLNDILRNSGVATSACEDWAVPELQLLLQKLSAHTSPELLEVYSLSEDARQQARPPNVELSEWQELERLVAGRPELLETQRDAHCRQAVLRWAHHVPEAARASLRSSTSLPLLPTRAVEGCGRQSSEDDVVQRVCALALEASICSECHYEPGVPEQTDLVGPGPFPTWPRHFVSDFSSPAKQTRGSYAIGVDRNGHPSARITMEDGSRDHLCAAYHTATPCVDLVAAGWKWLVWPELEQCCHCCSEATGCGALSAGWLSNASGNLFYNGEGTVHGLGSHLEEHDTVCRNWTVVGLDASHPNFYFEHLPDEAGNPGLPCAIDGYNYLRNPSEPADDQYVFDLSTFSRSVDPSLFDLPGYCSEHSYCGAPVCDAAPDQPVKPTSLFTNPGVLSVLGVAAGLAVVAGLAAAGLVSVSIRCANRRRSSRNALEVSLQPQETAA